MATNILTSLHANLEEFKQKKIEIHSKMQELTTEKELNEKNISELQTINISLTSKIKLSTDEYEALENTIGEIQSGYDSLLETGEFLMKLVNSNKLA